MKKIITCLLTLSMMFMFSITAFASDFSGNAESELGNISDKIVTAVNEVYSDKSISITAEDINYGRAFKVYVDTNVFELTTNIASEIENTLENGNYIYLLPIDTVNGTVVVNLQKGLPLSENAKAILSEEEQQEVLDNVGKWVVSSLALYKNGNLNYDYEKTLSSIIDEIPADTILVGGLPIFQDVVALIPNSDGVLEGIVPVTATVYDEDLVTYARSGSMIYDYEQIKEIANGLPEANSDMAGGTGVNHSQTNYSLIIGGILVLSVFVVGISLFFKKRNGIQNK